MTSTKTNASTGMLLGYARAGTTADSLEAQIDALAAEGVDPARIYSDLPSPVDQVRAGWAALLDYARAGDVAVVVGIDRLGRDTSELFTATRDLADREIGLRSLREGIDTADAAGAMIVGVLTSLAELESENGGARPARGARRVTGAVGRPRALDESQVAVAERMRAAGQPVPAIAASLGVSRATLYRSLSKKGTGKRGANR